nr:hypothetical protein [uncultured Methanoregula sp.]
MVLDSDEGSDRHITRIFWFGKNDHRSESGPVTSRAMSRRKVFVLHG